MKIKLIVAVGLLAPSVALSQEKVPDDFIDAVNKGYTIVTVIGQGASNQDHVIYMTKSGQTIVCGFRFVLTDKGFDAGQSKTLGACTGFVGAK